MTAAMSGAVDLAAVKARSEAQARAASAPPPTAAASVIDVSEATFQAEVLDRSFQVPVLLDLWADWCEPCKQLSPALEKLAHEGNGSWVLAKIDVDANPRIAQSLQVQSIPTVFAVIGGQLVPGFQGALPEAQLREFVAAVLQAGEQQGLTGPGAAPEGEQPEVPAGPPADPRFDAAEQALQDGDYDLAISRYQAILDAEPANAEAKDAIAQVRVMSRLATLPPDAVARAAADPTDVEAVLGAADTHLAAAKVDDALNTLLDAFARLSGDERDAVRARLVEYFEILGPDDPRVGPARRRLAAALF
ncbi:tetratricopeptide repeat protein [Jatrophihabitans sp. YIM 134969]